MEVFMSETFHEFAELIPQKIINRVKKLNCALLCDGMKGTDIPREGCMDAEIMPVNPKLMMIGTAMTIDTDNGDNFPIHVATYSAKPGYVMVIDGKGYKEKPYFGDLIMGAAQAMGVVGMVVDGYCRDTKGCLELKFPVYARGIMQRGVAKKNPGVINGVIKCGGVTVKPGDLVVGDYDGVTVVPRDKIEEILANAEEKLAYEIERTKTIKSFIMAKKEGKKQLPQLAPQWVLDLQAKMNAK
jgi:regulator of RNase E activity RraA